MKSTTRRVVLIAAWATAAVLGLGAAAAAATNVAFSDPRPTTKTIEADASEPGDGDRAKKRAKKREAKDRLEPELAARRVLHGEFVVRKGGSFVTVLTQKGTVTAVDASSLTVKSADGFAKTYAINGETKMRRKAEGEAGAFKVGDKVAVFAEKSGEGATAKRVFGRAPKK